MLFSGAKNYMVSHETTVVKEIFILAKTQLGLILGCLVRFKTETGVRPEKGRLFAILVSVGWHCIWNLRVNRVITNPGTTLTVVNIHNHWLKSVNSALQRDRILTDKIEFGLFALRKQMVLNTWNRLLRDEDSLPDDWTLTEGVLVGIWPMNGIG
jgi:ribonuclease HI